MLSEAGLNFFVILKRNHTFYVHNYSQNIFPISKIFPGKKSFSLMYGNVFVYNFKNAFCKLTLQKKIICKVAATFRENMCKAYLPFSVG